MEDRIFRMKPLLDEKQWRLYLANEAMSAGYGGVSKVNRITGVSCTTITKGIEELKEEKTIDGRVRRSGGGPKYVEEKHPDVEERIRKIVDGSTYGNPERSYCQVWCMEHIKQRWRQRRQYHGCRL